MVDESKAESVCISQARGGNPKAWDSLLTRYRLPLYVYIFQLVRNEQTSFDLVQETFVSAVRYLGTLQDDTKFGSWLFGIAHQKCIQLWRKQNREEALLKEFCEAPLDFEDDPRETLIRREQEAHFLKIINCLPLPQRSVILLYFMEDFSLDEIATITESSLGTVKSRLHYAKKALRELWKDYVT